LRENIRGIGIWSLENLDGAFNWAGASLLRRNHRGAGAVPSWPGVPSEGSEGSGRCCEPLTQDTRKGGRVNSHQGLEGTIAVCEWDRYRFGFSYLRRVGDPYRTEDGVRGDFKGKPVGMVRVRAAVYLSLTTKIAKSRRSLSGERTPPGGRNSLTAFPSGKRNQNSELAGAFESFVHQRRRRWHRRFNYTNRDESMVFSLARRWAF
jgi:hypothetical protein